MSDETSQPDPGHPVVELIEPLQRYVASRVPDPHEAADVVQETLTRVLAAEAKVTEGPLVGYALVVARNVIATRYREAERSRRHLPRMVDLTEPARPEDVVLTAEEHEALAAGLTQLPPAERASLVTHVVSGSDVALMARTSDSTPGAVSARLARARARLRLSFLLSLRRVELPTEDCRPVLLAVSAADSRRLRALNADEHLKNCPACADLVEPLHSRDRSAAGVLPWLPLAAFWQTLKDLAGRRPVQLGSAAVGVAAAGAVAVVVTSSTPPSAAVPAPAAIVRAADGTSLLPPPRPLAEFHGQDALATRAPVLAVPSNEGFWVGTSNARIWVQLTGRAESPAQVRAGQHVSFTGRVLRNSAAFERTLQLKQQEGAGDLERQAAHVAVSANAIRIEP